MIGHAERTRAPEFSTAIGLVRCGGLDQLRHLQRIEETSFIGRMRTFWRNFTRLFD